MDAMTRLGITGHRGLPTDTTRLVEAALRRALQDYRPVDLIGVTCLADGADQIFAQAVLDHGGQVEVIVPARRYREGLPAEAHTAYDKLLGQAVKVHELDRENSDEQAHMAASETMLAMVDTLLAVWDSKPARGYGGTADVVDHAKNLDVPVCVIWPAGASRDYEV